MLNIFMTLRVVILRRTSNAISLQLANVVYISCLSIT